MEEEEEEEEIMKKTTLQQERGRTRNGLDTLEVLIIYFLDFFFVF